MRVVGIDPGLSRTGVAIVDIHNGELCLQHATCVETQAHASDGQRLVELVDELSEIITAYRPELAAIEQLFVATNRRTVMRVSEARGALLYTLARHGLPILEYTPLQVKQAVAGWGGADKGQVGRMTAQLLHVTSIAGTDDTVDACAVAICHHHRARLAAAENNAADLSRLGVGGAVAPVTPL